MTGHITHKRHLHQWERLTLVVGDILFTIHTFVRVTNQLYIIKSIAIFVYMKGMDFKKSIITLIWDTYICMHMDNVSPIMCIHDQHYWSLHHWYINLVIWLPYVNLVYMVKTSFSFEKITAKNIQMTTLYTNFHCTSLSPCFIISDKNKFVNVSYH